MKVNGPGRQKLGLRTRKKLLAVGKACVAVEF